MEKKIIITRRFQNNTLSVYQYLLREFSSKTAFVFLQKLEKRTDFIAKNPTAGKLFNKRKNVRSILFTPHNQIFIGIKIIPSNYFPFLICVATQRKSLINLKEVKMQMLFF